MVSSIYRHCDVVYVGLLAAAKVKRRQDAEPYQLEVEGHNQ